MSTLLVVQSYAGAYWQVRWSFPHYQKSGFDILGCCPFDSFHGWPEGTKFSERIGKSAYLHPELVKTWVKTWETLLSPKYEQYDSFCLIEYDSAFVRQPPAHPGGLYTHFAGGALGGLFKASKFYHSPWWADRASAVILAEEGNRLIDEGEFENGSPDVFVALISDRRPDLKISETNTFSVNGGDLTNRKSEAIKVLKQPECFFIHGLRTEEELGWVLEAAR